MSGHTPECDALYYNRERIDCSCPPGYAWGQGYETALDDAIRAVAVAVGDRVNDLLTCGKDDDCYVKGLGADLALDDALTAIRALRESHDRP